MSPAQVRPLVGILMGSKSDWEVMRQAAEVLEEFGIPYEARVLSAHRTPRETAEYASTAEERGLEVIIAAAGMAAHLAGAIAAHTTLPVLGVPLAAPPLNGLDSLLSTVMMPKGVPVATFAVGPTGAVNAALFAAQILARQRAELAAKLKEYRQRQAEQILTTRLDNATAVG